MMLKFVCVDEEGSFMKFVGRDKESISVLVSKYRSKINEKIKRNAKFEKFDKDSKQFISWSSLRHQKLLPEKYRDCPFVDLKPYQREKLNKIGHVDYKKEIERLEPSEFHPISKIVKDFELLVSETMSTFLKKDKDLIFSFKSRARALGSRISEGLRDEFLSRHILCHFNSCLASRQCAATEGICEILNSGTEHNFEARFRKFHSNDLQLNYEVSLHPWPEKSLETSSESDLPNIGDSNANHAGNFVLKDGESVEAFYPIDDVTVLIVVNLQIGSKTVIYNLLSQKEKLCIPIGKTISASAFDPAARVVALHSDGDSGSVQVYKMDEDYQTRHTYPMIDTYASDFDSGTDVGSFSFCLQPRSDCLWVAMGTRVQKIDYSDRKFLLNPVIVESDVERLLCTSDGKCVVACTVDQTLYPIMTETGRVLTSLPVEGNSAEIKTFVQGNRSFIFLPAESKLFVHQVLVSGAPSVKKVGKGSDNLEQEAESKEKQREHWINCLYWMYSKFPCDDLLNHDQEMLDIWMLDCCCSTELQTKMRKEMKNILKKLSNSNKPMNFVTVHFEEMFSKIDQVSGSHKTEILGRMLLKLMTFVPLQIVRCQSNSFNILAANEGSPRGQAVKNTFDLASTVRFGYYDIVFSSWTGDIKVISSMGKQSSGKSYLLNHLVGTSFNIAGTRCTDGCWMTVKVTEDCLYVILDFEGLGSFERTDQEDMLLSLFNSAISTATIFKTEKRFERDCDKLFDKINLGSDQLKGTDKVFQGMFMIFVNDVAESDVVDAPGEFEEKLERIIQRSDRNFIRNLYRRGFSILCFPMFETEAYFESTEELFLNIRDNMHAVFSGGRVFKDTMKLLMAKLAINDFTPLGRQQIEERIKKLNLHMTDIIRFGQLAADQANGETESALLSYDDPSFSVPIEKSISLGAIGDVKLDDHKTILQESGFDEVVTRFVEMSKLTCDNVESWRSDLELYIDQCMLFRFDRIREWIKENFRKWRHLEDSESRDLIGMQFEKLDVQNLKYAQWFCLCSEKCSSCFLKCTHIANHDLEHECSTNHVCSGVCSYCADSKNNCALSFGHEGNHNCLHADHLCTESCRFKVVNGCSGQCYKTIDHYGDHECAQKSHPCNQICSLEICTGRCIIDSEVQHTVHKCSKDQCIAACCIENCSNKCTSTDHFHGTELSEKYRKENNLNWEPAFFLPDGVSVLDTNDHFCGKAHTCDNYCEHEGFCQVITEKHVKDEVFVGKKETFNYSLKFVETGKKHQCRQKIAPFLKAHDGSHLCSVGAHICTEKCPTCLNICNKPVDHQAQGDKLHHTNHGNMRNCSFVANADEINIGEHVYQVGEPAVAEMCHIFCKTLGRGHIHVANCRAIESKQCTGDKNRRHATVKYQPNEDEPKDELTHKAYWNFIGFEDPCSHELASEDFEKCPAYCDASCHDEKDKKYCALPLWHKKITSLEQVKSKKTGIISKDGHLFPCDHTVSAFHFVLCLDDSGSMFGKPWEELKAAVNSFINKRLALNPNAPDRVSIAIHNAQTRIVANFISLQDYKSDLLKFEGGENDFALALMNASVLIEKNLQKNMTPVLVFMSDGIWNNGDEEMKKLNEKFSIQNGLKVYTIGFGKINFDKLKMLAEIGKGEYIEAIDGVQLKNSFLEISSKHPPSIGISVQQAKARGQISF